jgi:F-type H+-transporting ATPase subunit delta
MHTDPVARIYAQALLELASDRGRIDAVGADLEQVATAVGADAALRDFIATPVLDATPKKRVIESLRGKVDETVIDFLCLLIDKGRIESLAEIAAAYRQLADAAAGRLRVRAATAVALPTDQRRRLEETLQAALQRQCIVEAEVDADLIGGLVLQIGDKVYDGSVRSQLRRVRSRMMRSSGYYENQG